MTHSDDTTARVDEITSSLIDRTDYYHKLAIILAERAGQERKSGHNEVARGLYERAANNEAGAATLASWREAAVTAGILYLSAAELALEASRPAAAHRLATLSLRVAPSARCTARAKEICTDYQDHFASLAWTRNAFHLPVSSDLETHDLQDLLRLTIKLTAVAVSLHPEQVEDKVASAVRVDWQTKFAFQDFYATLIRNLRTTQRPRVVSMQAASPGWLDIEMPAKSCLWIDNALDQYRLSRDRLDQYMKDGQRYLTTVKIEGSDERASQRDVTEDSHDLPAEAQSTIRGRFLSPALSLLPSVEVAKLVSPSEKPVKAFKILRSITKQLRAATAMRSDNIALF